MNWKQMEYPLDRYSISDDGMVLNERGQFLSGNTSNGYKKYFLAGRNYFAHRLVAKYFMKNFNKKTEVNHKNYDKLDNRVENLECVSHAENCLHAHRKERKTTKMGRPVLQFDLSGVLLKRWSTIKETGLKHSKIRECCLGKREKYKGFVWKYETEEFPGEIWGAAEVNGAKIRISNFGRVVGPSGKISFGAITNGYCIYMFRGKSARIHRLVAQLFLPCPQNGQTHINHKNDVKTDNRAENLEWVSPGENVRKAWETGARKPGLSERAVIRIDAETKNETWFRSIKIAAASSGARPQAIWDVCNCKTTRHKTAAGFGWRYA